MQHGQVGENRRFQEPANHSATGPGVHKVQDHKVTVTDPDGEITVRVYTPEGTGPFPVHINTHGGRDNSFRNIMPRD